MGTQLESAISHLERLVELLQTARAEGIEGEAEWLDTLAAIGQLESRYKASLIRVSAAVGLPTGARERILLYMRYRVGEVIQKEELDGVSGIQEWARRVRELRQEQGWPISTQENRPDLRAGEYLLERDIAGDPAR